MKHKNAHQSVSVFSYIDVSIFFEKLQIVFFNRVEV